MKTDLRDEASGFKNRATRSCIHRGHESTQGHKPYPFWDVPCLQLYPLFSKSDYRWPSTATCERRLCRFSMLKRILDGIKRCQPDSEIRKAEPVSKQTLIKTLESCINSIPDINFSTVWKVAWAGFLRVHLWLSQLSAPKLN